MRDQGELLEHAEFSGNMYATSVAEVKRISALGQICLLEIDLVGVSVVRGRGFPDAKFVFIEPPSFAELERRLRQRNTEAPESVERRLAAAKEELEKAKGLEWNLRLINDRESDAWEELKDAVMRWFHLPVPPEA